MDFWRVRRTDGVWLSRVRLGASRSDGCLGGEEAVIWLIGYIGMHVGEGAIVYRSRL